MFERIESGIMVMKNGKAWGISHEDGHSTEYGFIDPTLAEINDPQFCKKPTDVTYQNSPYIESLESAEICEVTRKTTVEVKGERVVTNRAIEHETEEQYKEAIKDAYEWLAAILEANGGELSTAAYDHAEVCGNSDWRIIIQDILDDETNMGKLFRLIKDHKD